MMLGLWTFLRNLFHPAKVAKTVPKIPNEDPDSAAPELTPSAHGPRISVSILATLDVKEWLRSQADVATALWRLRRRMVDPQTGEPHDEMRRAFRDVAAVWDALTASGIDIQDHTGALYDPGERLKVLAFQPMPEYSREMVLETIKPSIYFKGKWIQMGEVIVGMPKDPLPDGFSLPLPNRNSPAPEAAIESAPPSDDVQTDVSANDGPPADATPKVSASNEISVYPKNCVSKGDLPHAPDNG